MSESLAFTAAACQLGREMFMAVKAAYGLDCSWRELPVSSRQAYIDQAVSAMKAHAPSKIIGSITPEHPWGIQ